MTHKRHVKVKKASERKEEQRKWKESGHRQMYKVYHIKEHTVKRKGFDVPPHTRKIWVLR